MMQTPTPLNIVFMGTPDFAVPALEKLHGSQHQILAVITVPDKQQGRGRRERPSAVKQKAIELRLPVLQPEKLRDQEFTEKLRALNPDVIVVVAFRILPEVIFTIPKYGSFNLHASLLPQYRGAAPIHWALLNGDTESGVSTFFLKKKVDTGNIIKQAKTPILPEDNLHTLYDKLCNIGAGLVLETVDLIASRDVKEFEQDNTLASPAPKVTAQTRQLDFEESARQCHNRVRAFAPSPGAFTHRSGSLLKILASEITTAEGTPGTIIEVADNSFTVACRIGSIKISTVQPESKKAMDAGSYLRGYPFNPGDKLG